MANPQNLRPPWKPGESGNPVGHSKGRRQTADLLALIEETGATRAISKVWLRAILAGDFTFLREYLDRSEGKVKQGIDLDPGSALNPADEAALDIVYGKGRRSKARKGKGVSGGGMPAGSG